MSRRPSSVGGNGSELGYRTVDHDTDAREATRIFDNFIEYARDTMSGQRR